MNPDRLSKTKARSPLGPCLIIAGGIGGLLIVVGIAAIVLFIAFSKGTSPGGAVPPSMSAETDQPLMTTEAAPSPKAFSDVWISKGPEGGRINAIAIDPMTPTTIYAGTDDGLFKSTDGGESWRTVNTGSYRDIGALAIDPLTPTTFFYAGMATGVIIRPDLMLGVFRSTDGGENWRRVNTGLPRNPWVDTLAIDPVTPTTLYAGITREGVFKSIDSGENWHEVNSGLPHPGEESELFLIDFLAIDPLTPTTLYAGMTDDGLFKSTDGGENWRAVGTGLPDNISFTTFAIDPLTPVILYAATTNDGVYKSMDGGESWRAVNSALSNKRVSFLVINPLTPSTLYAGTDYGGMFISKDGGENWRESNSEQAYIYVYTLVIDPLTPTTLYMGTSSGVFKSTDVGGN